MKMLKLNVSGFDLGCIIAFAVLTLLGFGGWWYFSGELADAQAAVKAADQDFIKYSANSKYKVVVSGANAKTLQLNIDLLKAQLDPVIRARFLSKENKLHAIDKEDPVAWKHDLDDEAHRLNTEAKTHNVAVPNNFYYGFSRYLKESPPDEQTGVLSKQLVGIDQIASILIDSPVKSIQSVRRTYEEDANGASPVESDRLEGHSLSSVGNIYTAYPFEVDFQTSSENLRPVITGLMNSPYVFVIRGISVLNTNPSSPQVGDLDKMAGPPSTAPSVINADPGEVAAAPPTKGPQYLFGNSLLKVKMRIDMIEWNAGLVGSGSSTNPNGNPPKPGVK
jgi:hypothetical protein